MTPPTGPKPPRIPISIDRPPRLMTPPTRPEPLAPDPDPLWVEPEPVVRGRPKVTLTVTTTVVPKGPTALSLVVLALTAVVLGLVLGAWLARSVATPRPARSTVPIARDVSERRGDASAGLPAAPRPRPPGAAPGGPGLSRRVAPALPETATSDVHGTATWLCDPPKYPRCTRGYGESSFVAAAGSEIPRSWRGRLVRVWHEGRHVDVRLVDSCLCKGARVIDLYAIAFRRLAPTSLGEIFVTVELAPTRLPFTDTEAHADD